jgi:hypothetical protein
MNGGRPVRAQDAIDFESSDAQPADSSGDGGRRITLMQWSYGTSFGGGAPLDEPLHTDRPDFTEAATTVGLGIRQLEMGYTYAEESQNGERTKSQTYPELLFRYGILAEWLELRIGWSYAKETISNPGSRESNDGAVDMYLGSKIALTPNEGLLPEMALTPQMRVPTGADAFSADEVLPGVNWLYAWHVTDRIGAGGSTQFNRALDGETEEPYVEFAQSWTVAADLAEHLGSYLEWYAIVPSGAESERTEHYINGGFTFPIGLNLQFDVRAGVGLNEAADNYFAGTGAAVRF